jgi:catechol 2,3-dioxygenase-like lactoylglutathione lyase family enzyme
VDNVVGLDRVRADIAMMQTPDGHSRLELSRFQRPKAIHTPKDAPVNTLGIHRIMFAVDDIDDTVARLRTHGAELVGEIAQYENQYRLCYLRGPEASSSLWLSSCADARRPPSDGRASGRLTKKHRHEPRQHQDLRPQLDDPSLAPEHLHEAVERPRVERDQSQLLHRRAHEEAREHAAADRRES